MRFLLLSILCLLALSSRGQSDQLNQVQKLVASFNETEDVSLILEAQKLVSAIFENKAAHQDPTSLCAKAQIQTLALGHTDVKDPFKACDEIENTYASAFDHDQDRHCLLYTSDAADE